jgi:hypothetical protein
MLTLTARFAPRLVCALVATLSGTAWAQTYTNTTPISFAAGAQGVPFPSTLGVTGGPSAITNVTVTVNMINGDIAGPKMLLVAPNGKQVWLWRVNSTGGGSFGGFQYALTLQDGAPRPPQQLPNSPQMSISLGLFDNAYTFSPTSFNQGSMPGVNTASASEFLSSLLGDNANGTWSLYAVNETWNFSGFEALRGTIPSWSLTFNAPRQPWQATPTSRTLTYQGRLTGAGGAPHSGPADIRVGLWKDRVATFTEARVSLEQFGNVPVSEGLFSLSLLPPTGAFDDAELWAEVEVAIPAGSNNWVKLTPRQQLSAAPSAQYARRAGSAALADLATSATSAQSATTATTAATAQALDTSSRPRLRPTGSNTAGLWLDVGTNLPQRTFVGIGPGDNAGLYSSTAGWGLLMDNITGFVSVNNGQNAERALHVGSSAIAGREGLIRLSSRGDENINSRSWDVGVPKGNSSTAGRNYSFVIDDANNGAGPANLVIRWDTGHIGVRNESPAFDLDITGRDNTNAYLALRPGVGSPDRRTWTVEGARDGSFVVADQQAFAVRLAIDTAGNCFNRTGTWGVLSDARTKQDITPITGALARALALRGVEFAYRDDAGPLAAPGRHMGFLAQDVQTVLPDWVLPVPPAAGAPDRIGVAERGATALLVEALRELRAEKDAQIAQRDRQIADLVARLEKLEQAAGKR